MAATVVVVAAAAADWCLRCRSLQEAKKRRCRVQQCANKQHLQNAIHTTAERQLIRQHVTKSSQSVAKQATAELLAALEDATQSSRISKRTSSNNI
jgi:hypothetical protein